IPPASFHWPHSVGLGLYDLGTCRTARRGICGTGNASTQLDSIESSQSHRQGALMSSGELTRIDGRPISDNLQEIRAFLITWNDSLRLESALKHYRRLGVHRFFVADVGSTDGT